MTKDELSDRVVGVANKDWRATVAFPKGHALHEVNAINSMLVWLSFTNCLVFAIVVKLATYPTCCASNLVDAHAQ
jgi:hypothetical protein